MDLEWWQITTKRYAQTNQQGSKAHACANHIAFLNIKTGKTGARIATGRVETIHALQNIAERNYGLSLDDVIKQHSKDKIFTYREYLSKKRGNLNAQAKLIRPTSFSRLFDMFLREINLLETKDGKKRQFYSLRHTYATLMLVHDAVSIHTLAKQMGTSVGMIEEHYSHLDAVKAVEQLRGYESRQLMNSVY